MYTATSRRSAVGSPAAASGGGHAVALDHGLQLLTQPEQLVGGQRQRGVGDAEAVVPCGGPAALGVKPARVPLGEGRDVEPVEPVQGGAGVGVIGDVARHPGVAVAAGPPDALATTPVMRVLDQAHVGEPAQVVAGRPRVRPQGGGQSGRGGRAPGAQHGQQPGTQRVGEDPQSGRVEPDVAGGGRAVGGGRIQGHGCTILVHGIDAQVLCKQDSAGRIVSMTPDGWSSSGGSCPGLFSGRRGSR